MTAAAQSEKARWRLPLGRVLPLIARHSDTLVSMFDQGLVSGFGFAVGIGAARIVGIEEFGRFAIALIFAAFFQAIHNALFVIPMLSLAGRRSSRSRAYYATVMVMSAAFALGGGAVVALALAAFFGLRDGTLLLQFAVAGGLLTATQCVQLTMRRAFFAQGHGALAFAMDALRAIAFGLALTVLVADRVRVDAVLMLWVLTGSALVSVVAFGFVLRTSRLGMRIARAVASRHWAVARWLVGVPIVTMGQDTVVWIFAGVLFGDMAVGGLRATQYLFGPVLVLMAAMENVIPVRAAAAYGAGGLPALRAFLWRAGVALGLTVAGFLLLTTVPSRFLLGFVFGPSYAAYYVVAVVFGIATACMTARDYLSQYFRAIQKTEAIFYSFIVGAVVVLAAIYPLSYSLGLLGLALATLAGQAFSLVYLLVAIRRHHTARPAASA